MEIKYLTMDCPRCDEQIRYAIGCLNTPNNEFDIFELSQVQMECDNCGLVIYTGDFDYMTDPEEDDEEYDKWEENNDYDD